MKEVVQGFGSQYYCWTMRLLLGAGTSTTAASPS